MAYDSTSLDGLIHRGIPPPPFWDSSDLHMNESHETDCGITRCSICGLHIAPDDPDALHSWPWLADTLMVGDLSREYEYVQTNREYPAGCEDPAVFPAEIRNRDDCDATKGCAFIFDFYQEWDRERYFPYAADVDSRNGGPDGKNVVYIPMHKVCLGIALRSSRWDKTSSSRLRVLFRVLRHRFQVNWEQRLWRFPGAHDNDSIEWARDYVAINTIGFQNTQGIERGYFSQKCFDAKFRWEHIQILMYNPEFRWQEIHYLLDDPESIPSLTDTLFKNLESRTCPEKTKETKTFRNNLGRLPNELKLLVYEHLVQDQEWPLECNRLMGPRFWKALFNKDNPCMEWLWDLDFDLIRRTDPDLKMDWELLFRKLSQRPKIADCLGEYAESDYEIFRGVLDHVPPGLEGRRRIWHLVDEMRVGDRSTRWELDTYHRGSGIRYETVRGIAEVPVYWDSDGEPLDEEELRAL